MEKLDILCVGGDARMTYTAKELAKHGSVYTYATADDGKVTRVISSPGEMPVKADMLVLGLIRSDGLDVGSFRNTPINCMDLSPYLKRGAVVIGGKLNIKIIEYFSSLGFEVRDYLKREELVLKNTVPTAEGALEIALRELAMTVRDSRCLILGSGRVASACAELFSAVGAHTDICARNLSALTAFAIKGHRVFMLGELSEHIGGYDLIINTIPAMVLDRELLCSCDKKGLIIDLASMPGGADREAAKDLGVRCIHALGLPGKCAPVTAGRIIADTAIQILKERRNTDVT